MQTSDAKQHWEDRYRAASPGSSGEPGKIVQLFVEPLAAGRALELGCGKGDDAVWLAKSGWTVVAVDISSTALGYAATNAERTGVKDSISFEQHDLSRSFPAGLFDLVTASFLAASPSEAVLRRAAEAVALNGHLLVVDHATRLPWSSAPTTRQFPSAEETLAALALDERLWRRLHIGTIERQATGPNGQTALVRDSVVFLQRT